jgi:hypothetical protein
VQAVPRPGDGERHREQREESRSENEDPTPQNIVKATVRAFRILGAAAG